ncbi:MAG: hypothetical protein ACK5L7_02565 [Paludibacteraceae bacterium]
MRKDISRYYNPAKTISGNAIVIGVCEKTIKNYMRKNNISARNNNLKNRIKRLNKVLLDLKKNNQKPTIKILSENLDWSNKTVIKYLKYCKNSVEKGNLKLPESTPNPSDEKYTPAYAVMPLLKYVSPSLTVWCPFDTEESEFVKRLTDNGNKVIYSHISRGQDFYTYQPSEKWDIIISNPPFSNKRKIVERCLSFNKPFAVLLPLTWLNDTAPNQLFYQKEFELLLFDKRIHFNNERKINFACGYFCHQFLPRHIIFDKLSPIIKA